jgi:hypothetical protein
VQLLYRQLTVRRRHVWSRARVSRHTIWCLKIFSSDKNFVSVNFATDTRARCKIEKQDQERTDQHDRDHDYCSGVAIGEQEKIFRSGEESRRGREGSAAGTVDGTATSSIQDTTRDEDNSDKTGGSRIIHRQEAEPCIPPRDTASSLLVPRSRLRDCEPCRVPSVIVVTSSLPLTHCNSS